MHNLTIETKLLINDNSVLSKRTQLTSAKKTLDLFLVDSVGVVVFGSEVFHSLMKDSLKEVETERMWVIVPQDKTIKVSFEIVGH